jgi:hypothetical protein
VQWQAGARRELRFAIENATQRTVEVPPLDARGARVEVFADAEGHRACGVDPASSAADERIKLAPGEQVAVTVDLAGACGALPGGEYRYEVSYRVRGEHGGGTLLQTRYGTLVVEGPARSVAPPLSGGLPPRPGPGRAGGAG